MQQTLSRPDTNNWLKAMFARLNDLAKRLDPPATYGDVKFTDSMERELAEREYRRWR